MVSGFGPYFILIYSGYLQRKTRKTFNKACVEGRTVERTQGIGLQPQGSNVLGRQALYHGAMGPACLRRFRNICC